MGRIVATQASVATFFGAFYAVENGVGANSRSVGT